MTVLVVYAQNGEALRPEQGYPSAACCTRLGRKCQRKMASPDQGGRQAVVHAGRNFEIHGSDADGKSRGFTWLIDAKSVITFPCPEKPLSGSGRYTKFAGWPGPEGQGQGSPRLDDGGANWQKAELKEPCSFEGFDAVRVSLELGWQAGAVEVARDRRDRLCTADDRGIAQDPRHQFRLSQQLDPDLAGEARWEHL